MKKPLTCIEPFFIEQCISTFNTENQIDILQEECAELIQACSKVKRSNGHYSYSDPLDNLKEEMAHVLISIELVAKINNISFNDILKEVENKAIKYNFKKEKK